MKDNARPSSIPLPVRPVIAGILAFAGMYILSRNDYLLFHSFIELISVAVAFGIFLIAWNARRFLSNDYLLFIGVGFLFVSILSAMHTLSYRGMGVFEGYEPTDLAAKFWIAARYLQSITLLMAPVFIYRRLNTNAAVGIFGLITGLVIVSVLVWQIFPTTFVAGEGLTPFKVTSEFVISGILLGAILLLRRNRDRFTGSVVPYLTAAMGINIAAEMAFTLYSDAFGFFNALGHFLLIVSIYFIYKALIETGLTRPFALMFHDLKQREETQKERAAELTRANDQLAMEISERKKTESLLAQREAQLQLKLDSIMSPEMELGDQDLAAIFDLPVVQKMMEDLYRVTGVGFSIIDLKGTVLVGTGWQEICTEFHRKSPAACANCIESDLALTRGVKKGEFKTYKCKNNMWDIVTPLYIGDKHIANVFTGQFMFDDETPDLETFSRQAEEFGFDKAAYLDALNRVPRHSRAKVADLMDFFTRFATMISDLGYGNLKLAKSIADQQQTAKALGEIQADLNRAQEVSHLGSWRMDIQKDVLTWSDETYRMFEVPPGESMTYERFLGSVHPGDREFVDQNWQASIRREQKYDIEHRIIVNGKLKWVREKAELEFADDGSLRGGFGIVHDITDRKKAEETIRAAAEEWQATFDSITDSIMLLDPEHRIIRANRAFSETFGLSSEAAVGKHCYEIVHGTAHAPIFCPHARTMDCGAEAKEEFLEPKLGIYVEATTLPIIDNAGKCTGSVHIVKNIHERKTAEAEREELLRQVENQRQLLESTLDQLPSGVVIRDVTGNLVMGNSEIVRIFGPLPHNISEFDSKCCYHKDGTQYTPNDWPMNRTVTTGDSIENEEIEIIRDNGDRLTILAATAPVRNQAGDVIAHVGVFHDITERKVIEQQVEVLSRFPAENPNPVLRVNAQCILLYANPASVHVVEGWNVTVGGKLPDGLCKVVTATLESGDDRIIEEDCGGRTFSFVFTPIKEYRYVNLYGRDITERKRAEQALLNLTSELENRVEERTFELETAHTKLLEQLEFRVQAEESLRSLSSRLLNIQEEERRNIARELHDQTGQSLTVLKLMLGRADRVAPDEMKPLLKDISGMTAEIIKQVRTLSLSLRPGVLDDLGLVAAMEWLFKQLHSQAGLSVHFEHDAPDRFSPEISIAVYRITQESLTNIMRHAGAKEAAVTLTLKGGKLILRIEDRGHGFDAATLKSGGSTGLSAMRERAALLGGTCVIESEPGKGTVITISLPLNASYLRTS
ncbi:MASE3 domain-containing protein [Dehalogenimonas sp. THU2]|uniref:MASE3 domain-containing protein n=1 Tax=Dehalogenimonas sp. THU2 TaxID=3151121 RepID=UPI0032184D0D